MTRLSRFAAALAWGLTWAASCNLALAQVGPAGPGPAPVTSATPNITVQGTAVGTTVPFHDISGSGVAIVTGDYTKIVKLGAFTYTLAQAGSAGFAAGWGTCLLNVGAGNATINATTSVFTGAGGSTSLVLAPGAWACPASDGTNYITEQGSNLVAGSNVTLTANTNGTITIASSGGVGGLSVVRSYLAGLGLSNDGGTPNSVVDIAAGTAADSTNAAMITLGAFTKSTAGAWASGTAGNGMGNGLTIAATTWYHVILANNGGTPDIYFDTSVSGANRPAGISDAKVRRIGSFLTNGSSQIIAFKQLGDDFLWKAVVADMNNVTVTDTPSLHVLTVPTGLQVIAHVRSEVGTTSGTCLLSSPDENSVVANATLGNSSYAVPTGGFNFAVVDLRTDTSAEIRTACSAAVSDSMYLVTYGWIDRRGRDN